MNTVKTRRMSIGHPRDGLLPDATPAHVSQFTYAHPDHSVNHFVHVNKPIVAMDPDVIEWLANHRKRRVWITSASN